MLGLFVLGNSFCLLKDFRLISRSNFVSHSNDKSSSLYGAVSNIMFGESKDTYSIFQKKEKTVDDTPWDELFPTIFNDTNASRKYFDKNVDISKLKPEDPRFLDMPWPTDAGPESVALSKHLLWRRGLSDGERVRWQKWAVYKRLHANDKFDFAVEDFVYQTLLKQYESKASSALNKGEVAESVLWNTLANGSKKIEENLVRATIKAFYSAFSRQNFDDLRSLWLPDEQLSEIVLPGYDKEVGHDNVEKLLKQVVRESKPFGIVAAEVVSVTVVGYMAVVHSIETIQPGYGLKTINKKDLGASKKEKSPRKLFATTILRKFNNQWRLMKHHVTNFKTSVFTGNALDVQAENRRRARRGRETESSVRKPDSRVGSSSQVLPETLQDALMEGNVMSVLSKVGDSGEWERVLVRGSDGRLEMTGDADDGDSMDDEEEAETKLRKLGFDARLLGGMLDRSAVLSKQRDDSRLLLDSEDPNSVSKRSVQAVRALWKAGSITVEQKDILLQDIIAKVSVDETSPVESAFELLVMKGGLDRPMRLKDRRAMDEAGLEEFAEQCVMLVSNLKKQAAEEGDDF